MSDELRAEYQFDYRQAKPNRFAAALKKGEGGWSSSIRRWRRRSRSRTT